MKSCGHTGPGSQQYWQSPQARSAFLSFASLFGAWKSQAIFKASFLFHYKCLNNLRFENAKRKISSVLLLWIPKQEWFSKIGRQFTELIDIQWKSICSLHKFILSVKLCTNISCQFVGQQMEAEAGVQYTDWMVWVLVKEVAVEVEVVVSQ